MLKISVPEKELDILTIFALWQFEKELEKYIVDTLKNAEYSSFGIKYHIEVVKQKNSRVKIDPSGILEDKKSISLVKKITDYIRQYEELEVILPKHTLIIGLHVFEKKDNDDGGKMSYEPIEPRNSFDKLILPKAVKQEIEEALRIIENKDLIWGTWNWGEIDKVPRSVLNFYGPPGTGKTACAHAIAKKLNKRIIEIKYSEIESKYLGDSTKNLKKAFQDAKESDSVIFFDEADSFLGKRIQNVTHSVDQALNSLRSQMLIQLEEFSGIVIFATNLVTNFDPAFESRILKHIRIDLPNKEARAEIIKVMTKFLPKMDITSEDYLNASEICDGLSGREIKNAIFEMLLRKVDRGKTYVFTVDDIKETLNLKMAAIKELQDEHLRQQKEKIRKSIKESSQQSKLEAEVREELNQKPNG